MANRDQLRLLTLLADLPDEAGVEVMVTGLTRFEFDRREGEDASVPVLGSWAKTVKVGQVQVVYYTSEPPVSMPHPLAVRRELRLVKP